MAKNFNVSIILRILAEGASKATSVFKDIDDNIKNAQKNADDLTRQIKNLPRGGIPASEALSDPALKKVSPAATVALKDIETAIRGLNTASIGGKQSFEALLQQIAKVQNIKVDIDSASSIEELKLLEKELTRILGIAQKTDDQTIFSSIANFKKTVTDTRSELERLVKEQDKLDQKPVEVRILLGKEFPKVKGEIADFRKDLDKAKELGISVDFKTSGAKVQLNELIERVKALKTAAELVGDDPLKFEIELDKLVALRKELNEVGAKKDRIAREEISVRVSNTNELKDLDKEARKLLADLEAAKRAGNIKLVAELDVKRGELQTRLDEIRKPIEKLGQTSKIEIFEGVQNRLIAAQNGVVNFSKATAEASQNIIRQNEKAKIAVSDLAIEAKRVFADIKKAADSGNYIARISLEVKASDTGKQIQAAIKSEVDPKRLQILQGAEGVIGAAQDALSKFTETELIAVNDAKVLERETVKAFQNISKEAKKIQTDLAKATEAGNINAKAGLEERSKDITRKLIDLSNNVQNSGEQLSPTGLTAFQNAQADVSTAAKAVDGFNDRIAEVGRASKENLAQLGARFKEIGTDLTRLKKELKDAAEVGEASVIRPKIELQTTGLITELKAQLAEAERLGKNVEPIRLRIAEAENFRSTLAGYTKTVDELAKQRILVKVSIDENIRKVDRELTQLIKELDTAKQKGDVRLVVTIQSNIDKVQKELATLQSRVELGGTKQQKQAVTNKVGRLDSIQSDLKKFEASAPTTALGKFSKAIKLIGQDIGGTKAAMTSFAAGLRLIGTSAFLVGGPLRTVGFAFSAFGSIAQNFLPIVIQIGKSLASLGPPGLIAGGILTLLTGIVAGLTIKFLALVGALGVVISEGIQFNKMAENARNASAALAQQFFVFSVNGKELSQEIKNSADATALFTAASSAVATQLQNLQGEALTSLFTTQELFQSFQNLTIALGSLAPNLETVTSLTGKFARVGGLLGISANELGSSITQVVSGTGRVTNALQRLFNQTPDSKGSLLNPKRIRELRAAGGNVLITELSIALDKYTAAVRKANAESFSGVTSNFVDLLQVFSGEATKALFENLTKGLGEAFKQLGQDIEVTEIALDRLGNKTEIKTPKFTLNEDIRNLIFDINELLRIVGVDLRNAFGYIPAIVKSISVFVSDNFEILAGIATTIKTIVKLSLQIVGQFLSLLTLSTSNKSQLEGMRAIFVFIARVLAGIVLGLRLLNGLIKTAVVAGIKLTKIILLAAEGIAKLLSYLPSFLGTAFESAAKEVQGISDKLGLIEKDYKIGIKADFAGAIDALNTIKNAGKDAEKTFVFDSAFKDRPDRVDNKGKPTKTTDDEAEKERVRARSTLEERQKLSEGITKLALQREQNELKFVQDRLSKEASLVDASLNANLISQQAASQRILAIKQQEIDNEIRTRRNALAVFNVERGNKEKQFILELAEINNLAQQKKIKGIERTNKLEDLNLKQANDRIEAQAEIAKIEGEIASLEESRTAATLEYAQALANVSIESRKQLEDQQRSVRELQNLNDEETVRAQTLDLVREKIDSILGLQREIGDLDNLINGTNNPQVLAVLNKQRDISVERYNLLKDEIGIRQKLLGIQTAQNVAENLFNRLQLSENRRDLDVSRGIISERDALIEATAERIKYKEALEEALRAQQEILDLPSAFGGDKIANEERIQSITRLKQEIASLKTTIADKEILTATSSIRDSFAGLFDSLQEDIGNAGNALKDFGRSVLSSFRKLLSDRIVQEFFSELFPKEGQTEGEAGGLFGKFFRVLGLGRQEDQKKAEELAKKRQGVLSDEEKARLELATNNAKNAGQVIDDNIATLATAINSEREFLKATIQGISAELAKLGTTLKEINLSTAGEEAKKAVQAKPRVGIDTKTDVALEDFGKEQQNRTGAQPITLPKLPTALPGIIRPDGTAQTTTPEVSVTGGVSVSNFQEPVNSIGSYLQANSGEIVRAVLDVGRSLDSSVSSIGLNVNRAVELLTTISSKLDAVVSTIEAVSASSQQANIDIPSLEAATGGLAKFAFGGMNGFVSSGAKDGSRKDNILARLSNGEYVIQAPMVKKIGKDVLDYINATGILPKRAAGGPLFTNSARKDYIVPPIDTKKYDYSGGGAGLLNKPAPIVEQPKAKAKKKGGGLRGFFGNLLSFAAPFLSFIPGIGPLLSLGAGAAGGALSGQGVAGSILGGVLGGLSNLGGFSGKGGKLGNLADFFGSGKGKLLTGILGAQTGNTGGASGNAVLAILQKLGLFKKAATGGLIQKLALGGLTNIFSSIGNIFKGGKLGRLGDIFKGSGAKNTGGSSGGSSNSLLALFGISSILGGLLGNKGSGNEFEDEVVVDPDAERKNRFGSAYNGLVERGVIPAFQYSQETLTKLLREQEGLRNIIRTPKSGFGFGKLLTGFLPLIAGLLGGKNSGRSQQNRFPTFEDNPIFAATGGLIQQLASGGKVKGSGTSTSDSIPALLSNGEYVVKASSVRALGTDILDSINAGRLPMAQGGLVGPEIVGLEDSKFGANNVNVTSNTKIVNVLDPSLVGDYMSTEEGQKLILNTLRSNRKGMRRILS